VLTTKLKFELRAKSRMWEFAIELATGLKTICDSKTKFTEFERGM
jgi:hypothetical protein